MFPLVLPVISLFLQVVQQPVLDLRNDSNGWHLNNIFMVPPGKYDLIFYFQTISEPLPVAQELEIKKGEILEFEANV